LGAPLVAAAFGGQNTLMVSIFHERFGHRHFGSIVGLAGLCLLPASLLVSTLLASYLYDAEARAQGAQGADVYCSGPDCFRPFFLCLAAIATLGAAAAVAHLLQFRTFYARLAALRKNDDCGKSS